MLGSLMNSQNYLKITQDESGRANILGVPFRISEVDTKKINENIYELTPEINKSLTYPTDTGETMKNENDILMMNNIVRDQGCTGIGDRYSKGKNYFSQENFQS